jgi:hypothetical protein
MITWKKRPRRSVWGEQWTYTIALPELEPYIVTGILVNLGKISVGKIQQKGNTLVLPVDNSAEIKLLYYLEGLKHRLENPLWE